MSVRLALPFDQQCKLAGLPMPRPEFQFAKHLEPWALTAIGQTKPRKWAVDWAFVSERLALEVEGGYAVGGRHTRPNGFIRDQEKYNALALLGWRLLRVTPRDIRSGAALSLIQLAFPKESSCSSR
jgi:hypothetical protein